MSAFEVQGKTITFTANATAPSAVQCVSNDGTRAPNYLITNVGAVTVFVAYATDATNAFALAVIPTGTSQYVCPVLPGSQVSISAPPDAYFTGVSASSAIVYVTPGYGE